ncbi:MAG: hypothetical protein H6642_18195 [Caldilineaceae bacterium]|nr:hypothetical protein [Caldilineaceae bacterium]
MLRSPALSIRFSVLGTFLMAGLVAFIGLSSRAQGQSAIPLDIIPIYAIQGEGDATPLREEWVDTYGRVTGVTATGFYLQDPLGDGNSRTSDGIFVYTSTRPKVAIGDCVAVYRGFVDEYYEKTELSRIKDPEPVDYCAGPDVAPASVGAAQPGVAPGEIFETAEGMVVEVDDLTGTVQGATKRFDNGDVEIAFLPDPWSADAMGGRVFEADGDHMQTLMYVSGALGAELPDLNWGDRIGLGAQPGTDDAVSAILDYNFGKYQIILLPDQVITSTVTGSQPVGPFLPATQDDEITICSANLWGLGQGIEQFPDDATYAMELEKRAYSLAKALNGCLIVGLQETGAPEDAANLAEVLRTRYNLDYEATALRGPGTVNVEFPLTNSLLTRRDRVTVETAFLAQGCSSVNYGVYPLLRACPSGEHPLFNRPPLVADLTVTGAWGEPYALTVIDNHWKSKGGDESVNLVRRMAQAEHVAAVVQDRVDINPAARVLVMGDLNDFYGSSPVEALRTGVTPPLTHLYAALPALERYTYVFNGGSQVLDHMLTTANLAADVTAIEPVRINANYAYPEMLDVTSVHHASDHDPVAVTLRPEQGAWLGGNVRVPGVNVILLDEEDVIVGETETDAQGDFRLWRVQPGRYAVRLEAPAEVQIDPPTQIIDVMAGSETFISGTVHHRGLESAAAGVLFAPQIDPAAAFPEP